ncbi:arf-GAP with Rho-GAP domain, ANK repeat and PH domain-containing protein 3 [Cyprinodon tularosa]|uniref:arf-GAP with Rho-GAP domain, ANK repeat and PH domain-containing protein 3 n=1 Tax=Cyprinodon tularosa TaxID=77115 RepID=UPI0018E216B3|nr:arf-GAP with Rho-GAP domain, ANK repeat and PH domain-containing protein 3 [Cyprinodon tularosa]XP_038142614.1 arf-GAP with Rho-GAP domain, ANK repeat and PH domain-containing protein 3 [Cyprinodon tularosa]XP_038142615.1 arf-GAP with Rho-GAP domain, ANK repeat and PH domain-containing protein 3 [Cyprinodon tularosa]XP_038142616.1 arf-GAP with Rho-GAP domain, ANK repeat and PH domain-containing protein 3 [Cyprinodon tularosa]XP_038142617.1 arf-GAP with Rho-GAP domain, ANK repeat and PH domai
MKPDSDATLVVMASLDGSTAVETFLAAIHLERYLHTFRQAGLLLARDFSHLDHDALVSLGVTATGHRKRILRLVNHIQRRQGQRASQMADLPSDFSEGGNNTASLQQSGGPGNSPNTECRLMNPDRAAMKPVPKPRTVFNRRRTAPVQFSPPADSAGSSPRRMSQESICFTVLEDLTTEALPGKGQIIEATSKPASSPTSEAAPTSSESRRPSQVGRTRPSRSLSLSDAVGSVPPVPPRLNRSTGASVTSPSSSSTERRLLSSIPGRPGSLEGIRLSGSSVSPRGGSMEMVSNEIYWGTSPSSAAISGGRSYSCQQAGPPTPPRNLDRNQNKNSGGNLDRNSGSTLSNNSSGSARASTDDPEEEISPYCEAVFQTRRSPTASESDQSRSDGRETRIEEGRPTEDHGCHKFSWTKRLSQAFHSGDSQGYSTVGEAPPSLRWSSLPPHTFPPEADDDLTISPYASYTSLTERAPPIISGWLDKLSPQGNYVFQKRFVKFDGKNLMYFGSEKDVYPKGVIPLAAIQMARPAKDNKFEIVTSHRIFVFRTDNEVLRRRWVATLQEHVRDHQVFGRRRFGPGSHCQKHGVLELKGTKSKVYAAINTDQIWLYKSEQCFRNGIGITVIEARGATIRDGKHRSFDLITPYKTFSFTAESDREKRDWMEALQEVIAETLSDYEVAEKIWSNRSNRMCADCKALNPDWASINLCVVICKNCAGQHRGLGTMVSKVQSLKLDTSVWSNEIVQLFIMLGNDRANDFWAAHLSVSEELDCDATPEQRREFISQKYREGRFRLAHPAFNSQEELLKVLCSSVSEQTLLKTVTQIFSEAARLAADSDHRQQQHCLEHLSPSDPSVYDEIMQPILHSGFLYKASSLSKGTLSRKTREDFQKFWCSVDQSLVLYESEHSADPCLQINVKDIVCLGVSRPDAASNNNGFIDRFRYTFEVYVASEKLFLFGLETADALHSWTKAIGQAATPLSCHCLLTREFERVGLLRYRAMLDPQQWKEAYFVLQKSNLFICPRNDGAAEDIINLNRLQELSITSENENHEKKEILVLVEKGRTLHLQGVGRTDFPLWYSDIQRAAGGKGNALREQQMSRSDIPIIVDSCIAFTTQYGLGHEGIYRKNGAKSRIRLLMDEFRKDARNVKLRIGDHFIEDVTDVLKRFFREIDDPIFMAELHPVWQEAAKIPQKRSRLDRYKEIIRSLPRVNRTTLAALISHLYRVQKCADLNQMCTKNLSLLFAPSLFQTDGKGEHEVKIVEDLIDNYLYVFEIDEDHQTQIELEISLITSWKDTQLSQAGDLIIEVYLEMKIPDCCITLKVSPTMCAEELTNQVLYMRNVPAGEKDVWMTFEAIEDGQLERPLHPKEKVLEQALQWCKMADPSSAFLVVKKVPKGEGINILTSYKSEIMKVGLLRCREEPPKLLQGNRFQERTFQIRDHKLLLLKDKRSIKPEKEWALKTMKIYIGIRRKLKAPSRWGFTVISDKHQLFLCCSSEAELWDWVTSFLRAQNDDPDPPVLRRHSSSDISKQKFGTMPLVPIRGNERNSSMLSANQTLRKLHDRRTLSMYFPMKVQQDLFEERAESPDLPEPLYEEVGDFGLQVLKSLETSFRSSSIAETQEVPDQPPLRLVLSESGHLDHIIIPEEVQKAPGSDETLEQSSNGGGTNCSTTNQPAGGRMQPLPGGCTPSQELLLQELSSAFNKNTDEEEREEEEQKEEKLYDV